MPGPINTFIIYAREDKEVKRRILAHLNPFVRTYNLVLWHDEHLEAGQEWKPHIESRLEQTDLFLLLVSVDFMNSEFINQVEFKFAIDRHKMNRSIVIPIIINYCQWDIDFNFTDYNFNLNELQVLPDQGMPIDDWKTPEQAYNNIAAGIRKVLETIKNERAQQDLKKRQKLVEEEKNRKIEEDQIIKKAEEEQNQTAVIPGKMMDTGTGTPKKGNSKKFFIYGSGVLLIAICIWGISELRSQRSNDLDDWNKALTLNDSIAYAHYLEKFPEGRYAKQANAKIDSISESKAADAATLIKDTLNRKLTRPLKNNYYYSNFYDYKIMFLRNRLLSREEINICNQCLTYTKTKEGEKRQEAEILTNEEIIYADMNDPTCRKKKEIDDKTGIGYISTGILVELIETKGSFSHIKVVSNGVEGWISSKLQGKPTLQKPATAGN